MTAISFTKVESVGNDFVLVDLDGLRANGLEVGIGGAQTRLLSELARHACERRFSVGADGLLTMEIEGPDRLHMRMFNPDGTEDFCGNGLRCVAWEAFRKGVVGNTFEILHRDLLIPAHVDRDETVEVELPPASFDPMRVPHLFGGELFESAIHVGHDVLSLSCLTTGSTHTVMFVPELPNDARFLAVSQTLEYHPQFPDRTSVIWVREASHRELHVRIWERGAGETMGCGTGSSAAAVVQARRRGLQGDLEVVNPGGTVSVTLADWNQAIHVRSKAKTVYHGEIVDFALIRAHSGASR